MIKKHGKIIALMIAILICVAFIFSNSMKDSKESYADSDVFASFFEDLANKIAPDLNIEWGKFVRKAAHFIEFFVLGVFLLLFLSKTVKKQSRVFIIASIIVTLIACTDEFIQRFAGRSSRFADVLIDVFGAFTGFCVVLIIDFFVKHKRLRKSGKKE